MQHGNLVERFWASSTANPGTKLVSVVIAVVLWFVVLGSRNVETTKDVPLEVVAPQDLVISSDVPERVSFHLSGPKAFLRAVLDRHEDPIRVNLAGSRAGVVTYRFLSDNIRVPIGVKILGITPPTIIVKLESVRRREVPVRAEVSGVPPEGYKLTQVKVQPETIRIKGAESRVEELTELRTEPVDISELRQNEEVSADFDLLRAGVQLDGPRPKILIGVQPVSPNFRIKNIDIRVASSYKVRIEDKNVTVLVRVDPKELKSLDRSQVYGQIDLRGRPKGTYTVPVQVTVPERMSLVKVVPAKVTVTLY